MRARFLGAVLAALFVTLVAPLAGLAQDANVPTMAPPAADANAPRAVPPPVDANAPATVPAPHDANTPSFQPMEEPNLPVASAIRMNFVDAPLASVLKVMSQRLGLVILDGQKADVRVTIDSRSPLTVDEAVDALNTVLKLHDLTAIRSGRTLRIVTLSEAKTSPLPVFLGSDPDKVHQGDTLIRQIIPIRYGEAERLVRDLGGIIPAYAILGSNRSSNSLIYTATQSDVHHLLEVVKSLDIQAGATNTVRVFQLRNADATSAAKLVQDTFGTTTRTSSQQGGRSSFGGRFRMPMGGPPTPGGGGEETTARQDTVTTSADKATNSLVVSAPEDIMTLIDQVLTQLDKIVPTTARVQVFQLQYADATSTARLIEQIFNPDGTSRSSTSSSRGRGGQRFMIGFPGATTDTSAEADNQPVIASADQATNSVVVSAAASAMPAIEAIVARLDAKPTAEESIFVYPLSNAKANELEPVLQDIFQSRSTTSTSRATGATSTFAGRGGFGQQPGGGTTANGTTVEAGDLAGKVYVVAEEATNTLLVRTAPKYFDRVKEILRELDRPTRQVLIKVLIAEITLDNGLDLGTEFSVLNIGIQEGQGSVATDFGLAQLNSGLVARYVHTDFNVVMRALAQMGKLEVLSRPYLLGSENKQATITVGEEVPYITNSRVTEAGQIVNNVDYRDIGIILQITPYIGPDGMVTLDLSQEISSRTGRTVQVSEDFAAEVYAKRSADTRVAVQNGHTVVIGGLMQDTVTETVNKVPLLGDIPLLGLAFSRTIKQKQKTELLIFLCPQTALTPEELQNVTTRVRGQADLTKKAVAPGAFDKAWNQMCPPEGPCEAPNPAPPPPVSAPPSGAGVGAVPQ